MNKKRHCCLVLFFLWPFSLGRTMENTPLPHSLVQEKINTTNFQDQAQQIIEQLKSLSQSDIAFHFGKTKLGNVLTIDMLTHGFSFEIFPNHSEKTFDVIVRQNETEVFDQNYPIGNDEEKSWQALDKAMEDQNVESSLVLLEQLYGYSIAQYLVGAANTQYKMYRPFTEVLASNIRGGVHYIKNYFHSPQKKNPEKQEDQK
jgi:hypothetical protein